FGLDSARSPIAEARIQRYYQLLKKASPTEAESVERRERRAYIVGELRSSDGAPLAPADGRRAPKPPHAPGRPPDAPAKLRGVLDKLDVENPWNREKGLRR